jgi:hypothetical protein
MAGALRGLAATSTREKYLPKTRSARNRWYASLTTSTRSAPKRSLANRAFSSVDVDRSSIRSAEAGTPSLIAICASTSASAGPWSPTPPVRMSTGARPARQSSTARRVRSRSAADGTPPRWTRQPRTTMASNVPCATRRRP